MVMVIRKIEVLLMRDGVFDSILREENRPWALIFSCHVLSNLNRVEPILVVISEGKDDRLWMNHIDRASLPMVMCDFDLKVRIVPIVMPVITHIKVISFS